MIHSPTVQENFSRAAARYDAHALLQKRWRARVMAHALALLPERARVLDVGCGTGAFAAEAREIGMQWRVLGLDAANGMCRIAAQQCPTLQGDAACLPLASGAVDAVVSSLCLQWVSDVPAALREIHRALVPGGYALLMTLGAETLRELRALDSALRLLPMREAGTYREEAQAAGFEIVAMDAPVEPYCYESLSGLLRSFRQIGAHAAFTAPAQRLRPSQYHALADAYHAAHAHAQGGVVASWQPVLLILQKALA